MSGFTLGARSDRLPDHRPSLTRDRGVEAPVKVFEAFEGAELGGFGALGESALFAQVKFIAED